VLFSPDFGFGFFELTIFKMQQQK